MKHLKDWSHAATNQGLLSREEAGKRKREILSLEVSEEHSPADTSISTSGLQNRDNKSLLF